MPNRRSSGGGTTLTAPLFQRVRNPGKSADFVDEVFRGNARARADFIEDFLTATLTPPTTFRQTGAPVQGMVANAANGLLSVAASAGAPEQGGFHWGDALLIDSAKAFYIEFMVSLTAVAANARMVFGLGSAYASTLDLVEKNAWFRFEGNSLRALCEVDDGTNDLDDRDTGRDLVAGVMTRLTIDGRDRTAIKFYVNDSLGASLAAPLLTGNLQPMAILHKDSGAATPGYVLDYYRVSWDRE